MRRIISFRFAANSSIAVFGLIAIFHASIILMMSFSDFAPVDYLWGGRMQTKEQLLVFELISFTVNLITLFLTLIKARYLQLSRFYTVANTECGCCSFFSC